MVNDSEQILQACLDTLLAAWHGWERSQRTEALGYPTECPACRMHRTSRQYDSDNGAFDDEDALMELEAVGAAIVRIGYRNHLHAAALYEQARDLFLGTSGIRNPRLPADPAERARILAEGRQEMVDELGAHLILRLARPHSGGTAD